MFVHWREREHEEVDQVVFDDDDAKQSLHACGMYNFFQIGGMRAQRRLLNLLIDYWHPDAEAFMLAGKSLTITIEDIYFITGLSRRGEVPNFQTQEEVGEVSMITSNEYCDVDTEKSGSQVPIKQITNLSLQVILYTMVSDRRIQLFAFGFSGPNATWGRMLETHYV
jgi:hypothetical protein